jgi:hypothetical protein
MAPDQDRPPLRLQPTARAHRSSGAGADPSGSALPAHRLAPLAVIAAALAVILAALSVWTAPIRATEPSPTFAAYVTPGNFATATPTVLPKRVSTRVRLPALRIDLPVVKSPPAGVYPYCNVAMYLPTFGQPGWGRTTFIYAHARTGMFLTILRSSQVNNGAGMIGKSVYVYTSDRWLWRYVIKKVYRHQTDLSVLRDIKGEALILQTSEGPRGTKEKLLVLARLAEKSRTTWAASHPTPHIVRCS